MAKRLSPAEKLPEMGSGYVYLIRPVVMRPIIRDPIWYKDNEFYPIKIGVSRDNKKGVELRLKTLSSGNWNKLCIEMVSPRLWKPFSVEYYLHTKYWHRQILGEWYELTLNDIEKIKEQLRKEPEIEKDTCWTSKSMTVESILMRANSKPG